MSLSDPIRLGAYGFAFEAQLLDAAGAPVDIGNATLLELRLERPDGSVAHRTATLTTNGADGRVRYVVQAGDLNQAGSWRRQFVVETPTVGFPFEPEAFPVQHNLP